MRPTLLIALLSLLAGAARADDLLVFSSGRSGEGDLYAFDPGTGEITAVVATPAPEGNPRHDPHGGRLVHTRFDENGAMLLSGDDELFADPTGDASPVWSASGAIAYVLERDGTVDLFLADAQGGNERRLTDDPGVERYPAWSPDGRTLAIAQRTASGWELQTIDVDSGARTRLTEPSPYVGHLAWSPDGERIACDMGFEGQTEVVVLDLATGKLNRITHDPGNDMVPAWSANGRRLAFGRERDGNWDVWIVDLESGAERRITEDPAFDGGPVWIPREHLAGR